MRIVVVGGSAAGLLTALVLARTGHDVVVVERDDLAPAVDVEASAAAAFRAAAPQVVQPHVVLPAFREVLRERLPGVYEDVLAAGALEAPFASQMPSGITDRTPMPGDDRFTFLLSRRATLDWVLARAAAAAPGVEVRYGAPVTGLVADDGDPPRVRGVRTALGQLAADVVVLAGGRRTPVDRWLRAIRARPSDVVSAECGLAYYGRQYRVRDEPLPGPLTTRVVMGLDEFVAGIWGGDNGSVQLAIAPLAADRRFVAARDPDVFTAVLRSVAAPRRVAGRPGPDHRAPRDGRAAQQPASARRGRRAGGPRGARRRGRRLHHQPDARPRAGPGRPHGGRARRRPR